MGHTRLTKVELEFARSLAPHVLWAKKCELFHPRQRPTITAWSRVERSPEGVDLEL